MAIEAITGKKCTITVDEVPYTAWITSFDVSAEKAGETVAVWGPEDVPYGGRPSYSAQASLLFDPNAGSFGDAMEAALAAEAPVDISVDMGGAVRTLSGWLVTSYSDNAPADSLVTCQVGFTGAGLWATTYVA